MPKIIKKPSRASIRRALTTLKRAELIKDENVSLYHDLGIANILVSDIPMDLLAPKKSVKKRIPKVKQVV